MSVPAIINGILTHGAGNVDRAEPHLLGRFGTRPIDVVLPKRGPFETRRWKVAELDSKIILQTVRPYGVTHVMAHSFGAPRILMAAQKHEFEVLLLVRPALNRHFDLDTLAGNPTVICVYSTGDWAVRLGALMPLHLFGRAGCKGMSHNSAINVRSKGRHGADFAEPALTELADLLHDPFKTLSRMQKDEDGDHHMRAFWSDDA